MESVVSLEDLSNETFLVAIEDPSVPIKTKGQVERLFSSSSEHFSLSTKV